jgi:hypothetical protein
MRLLELKLLALAGALWAGVTAAATAQTVGYDLRISESLPVLKNPNDMHAQMMAAWTTPTTLAMARNRPYLLLENTSTVANGGDGNAQLTTFSMTIGDTSQTFDWSRLVSASPGVGVTLVTPDTKDNHLKNDVITYNFTGFTPGMQIIFHIDIDPDLATANPFTDYRQVLFTLNGGSNTAGNSQTSGVFVDNGQTIHVGPTPWNNPIDNGPTVFGMQFVSHYMDDHVTSYLTGNVVPVPEPSSFALAGIGLAGLLWGGRRIRRERRLAHR